MRTTQIRQYLHEYIESADDKKLKAIYILLEDDRTDEYTLTAEQRKELDRRYGNYQNGIGKTYTWEEAVAITDKALADRKK
jgi:Putative addiction module component